MNERERDGQAVNSYCGFQKERRREESIDRTRTHTIQQLYRPH